MLALALGWSALIALLTWRSWRWGLAALIAASSLYLVRTVILGIPTTALELGIYAAAAIWLSKGGIAGTIKLWLENLKPYRWPLALWLGFTLVSALASSEWRLSFGIIKGWFFDPLLVTLLLTSLQRREGSKQTVRTVWLGLAVAALAISLYGLVGYVGGYTTESGRLDAWFTSPNYAAMFLGPVWLLSLAWLWHDWLGGRRWWLVAAVVIQGLALYLTGSFGGWVAVMTAVLAALLIAQIKQRLKAVTVMIVVLLAILAVTTGLINPAGHYNDFFKVSSWQVRAELQRAAVTMIKQRPIFGVGLGRFQRELPALRQNQPELFKLKPELLKFHLPHSLYLTIASESGLPALIGFLWFVGLWLYQTYCSYRRHGSPLLLGTVAAMVAILIHGLVDTPYFKNDLSLLFWLIIMLAVLNSNRRREPNPGPVTNFLKADSLHFKSGQPAEPHHSP